MEKPNQISLKSLYEMFKDTNPMVLFPYNFYQHSTFYFGGDIRLSKDIIAELYKNLLLETFSGQDQIEFEKISDLTLHINFKMKHSILSNLDRKDKYNIENNAKVKEMH